jgi:hypothetical protein
MVDNRFLSRKAQATVYEKKYEQPLTRLWMKHSPVFLVQFFQEIRPKDITHEAVSWRFAETIDLL